MEVKGMSIKEHLSSFEAMSGRDVKANESLLHICTLSLLNDISEKLCRLEVLEEKMSKLVDLKEAEKKTVKKTATKKA